MCVSAYVHGHLEDDVRPHCVLFPFKEKTKLISHLVLSGSVLFGLLFCSFWDFCLFANQREERRTTAYLRNIFENARKYVLVSIIFTPSYFAQVFNVPFY